MDWKEGLDRPKKNLERLNMWLHILGDVPSAHWNAHLRLLLAPLGS